MKTKKLPPETRYTMLITDDFEEAPPAIHWRDPLRKQITMGRWRKTFWRYRDITRLAESFSLYPEGLMMGMSYRVDAKGEDIAIGFSYLTVRLPLYFDSGSLAISLDHTKVIHLRPGPSNHHREYAYDSTHSQYVDIEDGYWQISREELKQICNAEYIAIRITAGSEYWELEEDIAILKFRFMCRSFYQSVYEDYTYRDWLDSIVPEGTEGQSDGALLIVIGYVLSFLLPVALIIGGYICISRQENIDGEKVSKYSSKARMHAIAIMVISILLLLWFTRSRWAGA